MLPAVVPRVEPVPVLEPSPRLFPTVNRMLVSHFFEILTSGNSGVHHIFHGMTFFCTGQAETKSYSRVLPQLEDLRLVEQWPAVLAKPGLVLTSGQQGQGQQAAQGEEERGRHEVLPHRGSRADCDWSRRQPGR